jgi:biopolymer transport protein ExbD
MKLNKLRAKRSPQIMIIPMIDIIFFLLVFFMMSTLYMVDQNIIPVNLPQAATAQPDSSTMIPITLTSENRILLGQEEIPPQLLAQRIQVELARNSEVGFVLRADQKVEYGYAIRLLDELKKLGVHKVAVATELKSGQGK